jgi:hypothetical protein
MPQGELEEHVDQLPEMIEVLSGGTVKLSTTDDDE